MRSTGRGEPPALPGAGRPRHAQPQTSRGGRKGKRAKGEWRGGPGGGGRERLRAGGGAGDAGTRPATAAAAAGAATAAGDARNGRLTHVYAVCVDCLEGVHEIVCVKCKSRWDGGWPQLGTVYTCDILAASPCCQARLNCKHCGKLVIDVRVGMRYFSKYSNVQQCPHCGNLDYHFVKPFSSFKVLEAY